MNNNKEGIMSGSECGQAVAARISQVDGQVNRQAEMVDELASLAINVREALHGVCTEPAPEPPVVDEKTDEQLVPVASRIRNNTDSAYGSMAILRGVLERLEV